MSGVITAAARRERRRMHREAAARRAIDAERSMTCIAAHTEPHEYATPTTCAGLRAGWRFGCLCPCHDPKAAP